MVSTLPYQLAETRGCAVAGIGWNMNYPFNTGDLLCCGQCASNYLDNNVRVPWDDLRYIFGEIMYGGHIVEDWDRRLASAYLSKYFNESLLEGMELFPAFTTPPSTSNHRQVGGQVHPRNGYVASLPANPVSSVAAGLGAFLQAHLLDLPLAPSMLKP